MTYTLACADTGIKCPYVAQGETMDELWTDAGEHAKRIHSYTDEQLNDPELVRELKAAIKQK
jgi:predicted small metal-binding protein